MDLRRLVNHGVAEGSLRFATLRPLLADAAAFEASRRRLAHEVLRAGVFLFPDLEEEIAVPVAAERGDSRAHDSKDSLAFYLSEIRRFVPTSRQEEESLARAFEIARDALALEILSPPHRAGEATRLRRLVGASDPLVVGILERLAARRPAPGGKTDPPEKFERVRRRLSDARRVRSVLVAKNLHLVPAFAARYRHFGVPYLDLIQEGNAALFRAADKFDWRKGVRFPTYAQWWVQQAVLKCLYSQSRVVRLPVYLCQKLKEFREVSLASFGESGRALSPEELSATLEEPISRVRRALRSAAPAVSLDREGEGEGSAPLRELVADPRPFELRDEPPGPGLRRRLEGALASLSDRERRIVRLRYGLEDGRAWTLEEVSQLFGVSRERIRQIQVRALLRMKGEAERSRLAAFLG